MSVTPITATVVAKAGKERAKRPANKSCRVRIGKAWAGPGRALCVRTYSTPPKPKVGSESTYGLQQSTLTLFVVYVRKVDSDPTLRWLQRADIHGAPADDAAAVLQ